MMTKQEFRARVQAVHDDGAVDVEISPKDLLALLDEMAVLRAGLEGIAKDPHCDYPDHLPFISDHISSVRLGIVDGHRCAAAKARATLAAVDKGEKGERG